MLVLEGGDLAGKTTLGELLAKEYGVPLLHMHAPKDGERDMANVSRLILGNSNNIICDRMCLGDFAYRAFWPRSPQTSDAELQRWLKYLTLSQSYLVYADPGDDMIKQRYDARGDAFLTLDRVLEAANNYRGIFEYIQTACAFRRVLPYDSGTYTPEHFIERFKSAIDEAIMSADLPFEVAYDVLHGNEATSQELSRPPEAVPAR